jgi:hypothetical protein
MQFQKQIYSNNEEEHSKLYKIELVKTHVWQEKLATMDKQATWH